MSFANKKLILQIFLVVFIILNLFDFFNALPGDIDFFKKILSWFIIGYIFYKASPTKIFVGIRYKVFDLIYIVGFCFIAIVKSIAFYSQSIDFEKYVIFGSFLNFVKEQNLQEFVLIGIYIGIFIVVLNSVFLLLKNGYKKNSFLGSMNFSEYFKFIKIHYLFLVFYSLFFAFVIFNFFMEWFALAVDSIILILGLAFYIFKYFHSHTKGKVSCLLEKITNTGNDFYKNLIELFKNKKTVFIGMSFLLTLHLLVDAGVYLIPYTIGTENTLYFDSLDTFDRSHAPVFNFKDIKESQFYNDYNIINNESFLILFSVLLIYVSQIFMFFFMMLFPFYFYYNKIQKNKVKINRVLVILFLSSIVVFCFLYVISDLNNPIKFSKPDNNLNVKGVDIYTNNIINYYSPEVLVMSIIFFLVFGILMLFYSKYKRFFDRIVLSLILIIFVSYIGVFYISSIESEVESIKYNKQDFKDDYSIIKNSDKYYESFSIFRDKKFYSNTKGYSQNIGELNIDMIAFSDLIVKENNFVEFSKNHRDFIYLKFSKQTDENLEITMENLNDVYFRESVQHTDSKIIMDENEIDLIYKLGENVFLLRQSSQGYFVVDKININSLITNVKTIEKPTNKYFDNYKTFIEYLKIIFLSIFYIFGLVSFIKFYVGEKN